MNGDIYPAENKLLSLLPLRFGVWLVKSIHSRLGPAERELVAPLTTWLGGLLLLDGPAQEHVHLVLLLASVNGVPGRSGLDGLGRSGFTNLAQRLMRPAPYPRIAVQPLPLPPVRVLQSWQDQVPWYASYPFVARRRLCAARGPHLADGFVAKVEPGIRGWRKEARW